MSHVSSKGITCRNDGLVSPENIQHISLDQYCMPLCCWRQYRFDEFWWEIM